MSALARRASVNELRVRHVGGIQPASAQVVQQIQGALRFLALRASLDHDSEQHLSKRAIQ